MGLVIESKLTVLVSFFLVCLSSVLLGILCFRPVGALTTDKVWSWTDNPPTIISSNKISGIGHNVCTTSVQSQEVAGEIPPRDYCMFQGENVKVGISYYYWFGINSSVAFSQDSQMHKLFAGCDELDTCTYIPEYDTLIIKKIFTPYSLHARSFNVYRNFSKRLKKIFFVNAIAYEFDSTNPDYVLRGDEGYIWAINGSNVSENGKWVVVELWDSGVGLFNVETLQMKRVTTDSHRHGVGSDPSYQLAVSNDGKHVAVMGLNAWFAVYDVNSSCGDGPNYGISNNSRINTPCPRAITDVSGLADGGFFYATYPRFNNDGGELTFYIVSRTMDYREVILRASGYAAPRMDYLALGDSYTSGEGESSDDYYQTETNDEYEKCHVSARSYPYILGGLQNIDPLYVRNVACSGATTEDIIGDDINYWGQGGRLAEKGRNLDDINKNLAQTEARYSFTPGRIHQERFVKEYLPKVITVGVGGNDAGLMDKIKACLMFGTCNWVSDAQKKEQAAVEIKGIFGKLVNTYQQIHNDSPKSKIYAVGYPLVVDENGSCGHTVDRLLNRDEKIYMNESVKYLNQVIEAAARSVGVEYIDIHDSLGNYVLCGSESPSAVNGVRLGDDDSLFGDSKWFRVVGHEGFHPNAWGHMYNAFSINNSISSMRFYNYCPDGATACPDKTVVAPQPDNLSYWYPDGAHNYPKIKADEFVIDCSNQSCGPTQKNLKLDPFSLSPDSNIEVEINSEPVSLGQFTVPDDGSLDISVNLPDNLEEGYHTMHIYGISYSGDPVDIYQLIEYWKPVNKSAETVGSVTRETVAVIENSTLASSNHDKNDDVVVRATGSIESDIAPSVQGVSTVVTKPSNSGSGNNTQAGADVAWVPRIAVLLLALSVVWIVHKIKH